MASDMSGEQMQAKITAARREAEGLKDRIKRKKDDLADTTRKFHRRLLSSVPVAPLSPPADGGGVIFKPVHRNG